jgi:ubiquinone/menaquinone biosynthesis C-methylase UbiE
MRRPTRLYDVRPMPWNDARTAELYDDFTRRFPMYDETSRDLVDLAGVADAATIVDLACGTGATTRAVLEAAPPHANVVAIDGSQAMLDVAARSITDDRVTFVHADATGLTDLASGIDAIVCNSAIWQTDMRAVFAAAAQVLRPGGRFAFNISRQFMIMPFTEDETSQTKPSIWDYAQAIAVLDHDYVQPMRGGRGRPLSREIVEELLTDAGLQLATFEIRSYEATVEQDAAWLKVPVFADNIIYGMPYEQQAEVIDRAYERADKTAAAPRRWGCFVATASR